MKKILERSLEEAFQTKVQVSKGQSEQEGTSNRSQLGRGHGCSFFGGHGRGIFNQRSRGYGSSLIDGCQYGQGRQHGRGSHCRQRVNVQNWQLYGQNNNYGPMQCRYC